MKIVKVDRKLRNVGITFCILAAFVSSSPRASGQPRRTKPPTHEELYARVKANPVITLAPKSVTGAPLNDAQKADMKKADDLQEKAEQLFDKAQYADAAAAAGEAAQIRGSTVGPGNYLAMNSTALMQQAKTASKMAPAEQAKFTEAETALNDWESLNKDGHYEEARSKAEAVLAYAKANLPPVHPLTAMAYLRLGTTLIDLGDYNESLKNLNVAESQTKTLFGRNHPRYALVMDRLGWVKIYLAGQGVFSKKIADEAVNNLQMAVQIYRTTVGETVETAESLDNLGTALLYTQKVPEAIDSKLRALFIRQTLLGPDARDTGVSLSNIAWLYGRIGLTSEALPLRERALNIFKKLLRPDHPYIYLESANLGWEYHLAGRDDEAIRIFEDLVAKDKDRKEKNRPDVVQRLARLAEVYAAAEKYDSARSTMKQAFEATKALFAGEYPEQAVTSLEGLARSAQRARMFDLAQQYFAQLCNWGDTDKTPIDDADRGMYDFYYGSALIENGEIAEAKKVLTKCLDRLKSDKPEEQVRLIQPLLYLSRAETALGNYPASIKAADQAVQIAEGRKSTGPDFALAFSKMWLGRAYSKAGNVAMAEFSLKDAETTLDTLADRDPTGAILVRIELAELYQASSKRDEAIKLLNDALAKCRDIQSRLQNAQLDAVTARVLYTLYDITASGGATAKEREDWKKEALSLLSKLENAQLLNADEKAWLAKNR